MDAAIEIFRQYFKVDAINMILLQESARYDILAKFGCNNPDKTRPISMNDNNYTGPNGINKTRLSTLISPGKSFADNEVIDEDILTTNLNELLFFEVFKATIENL